MADSTQFRNTKGAPKPVVVTWKDGQLLVDPDPVRINWEKGPDSVAWKFVGLPAEAAYAVVSFSGKSCFDAIGGSKEVGILGTLNTKVGGEYGYSIAVFNADGEVLADKDPGIINDPDD